MRKLLVAILVMVGVLAGLACEKQAGPTTASLNTDLHVKITLAASKTAVTESLQANCLETYNAVIGVYCSGDLVGTVTLTQAKPSACVEFTKTMQIGSTGNKIEFVMQSLSGNANLKYYLASFQMQATNHIVRSFTKSWTFTEVGQTEIVNFEVE